MILAERRAAIVGSSLAASLAWTLPSLVHAGNAAEPRVPPSFLGTRCIEVLAPGDPALHLTVGIPLEEGEPTADEPPGTRSFQFFAACREPRPGEDLPPWIEPADIEAAQAANPELGTPDPSLVLPTSPWVDCLVPLTPSDPRMPISCEGTAAGVDLSPEALPPGNHVVYGYTYEPDKNLWTARDGVVRVLGPEGDAGLPPAVALTYPLSDAVASTGVGVMITGCAAGLPGTEVELSWATVGDLAAFGEDAWEAFDAVTVEDDADDSSFAVPFVPPAGADYSVVRIRAIATDPKGGRWVSYSRPPLVLEPGCADPEGGVAVTSDLCGVGGTQAPGARPEPALADCLPAQEDEPGTTGNAEDTGDDAGSSGSGGEETGGEVEAAGTGGRGGCRVACPRSLGGGALAWLVLLAARRRGSGTSRRRLPHHQGRARRSCP